MSLWSIAGGHPAMRSLPWAKRLATVVLVLVILLLPQAVSNPYYLRVAVLVLIYYMAAMGYNAIITTAGLFHFGFVMYFALGAYIGALLTLNLHMSFWVVLPTAVASTVILAVLFSVPTLRFKGDYLCLITLAFAEIVRLVLKTWMSLTNGPMGLPGISPPRLFSYMFTDPTPFYYLSVVLAAFLLFVIYRLTYSQIGLAWSAIRQSEDAAEASGVKTLHYKHLVMAVGAGFAAVGGALMAHFTSIVDPSIALMDGTVLLLTIVILGGGSPVGLLLSALLLTVLPELLRGFVEWRMFMLGCFFIVIMNLRPEGFTAGVITHIRLDRQARQPDREERERKPPTVGIAAEPAGSLPLTRLVVNNGIEPTGHQQHSAGLLDIERVTKWFGGLAAVNDVSISVKVGEILAIIGPNGAGKTTLFNTIMGTYPVSTGRILFRGRDIRGLKPSAIAKLGIGRTFQNIKLFPKMTVLDNIMVSRNGGVIPELRAAILNRRDRLDGDVSDALRLLDYVHLKGKESWLAGGLPYADQRRLEIARALALDPVLLLLDEPSAGMNPAEQVELLRLLQDLNAKGLTTVIIEHNMKLAMNLSQRVVVLNYGTKIAEGKPGTIQRTPEVIKAYLGERYVAA